MKNKKIENKKNKTKLTSYIINILLVISIFYLALFINDIKPFGIYDIAKHDGFYQYKPMLFNFIKNIQEGTLLNYSFLNSLGNSFFFNYTYYLSSPINFLALPFKDANTMFLTIISIKLIITSITTTFFASKKTNNTFLTTIITISYVFSGWFLAYNQSIMWLDAFMIFPLFQYGLEKLLTENKPYIYIFSLAYIMISNFYMAWIICVYTLAYFIYQIITNKQDKKVKIKQFNSITLSTLTTILLSFFYIYMTYDSFMNIGLYINNTETSEITIPLLNLIKSFFTGNTIVTLSSYGETFPNIALNTILTISTLYYFFNNNIDKKERIKTLIIFLLIILVLYSDTLNYIINCFHIPIGYNFRYSFLISFFMIYLLIKNYKVFNNKIDKKVFIITAILTILLIIELIFKNIETKIFILNLIAIIIYTILFIFYKNSKLNKYLFTIIIIIETTISTIFNITSPMKSIEHNYEYSKSTNYREIINNNIDDYYLENSTLYTNKSSIPYFSSMQYNYVLYDLQSLGCTTDNKATITLCPYTPVLKSLINIKTDNDYHLEKIFAISNEIKNIGLYDGNYYENQNLLLKTLANSNENVLIKEKLKSTEKSKNKYKITETGTYYLQLKGLYQVITINNVAYTYNKDFVEDKEVEINEIHGILQLELNLNKNDTIEIKYPSEEDIEEYLEIYYFNKDEFEKSYNILKQNQINYTSYQDNKITGTINVNKDQIIYTSIPYDKHWEVKIDGKKVQTTRLLNSLLGIECEQGTHEITLEYKTNFTIPILISITTLFGIIINILLEKRKKE